MGENARPRLSHSNSFGNDAEKDTAGCRVLNRKSIVIGGEGFRFPSPPSRPPQYSPQEPRFTRGIAAATYAKNMPQAYFLNAAALARGATPPAALGAGCTTRTWVMVQIRHCDYHTVVRSRQTQFDSRPRGEWLFVEVNAPKELFSSRHSRCGLRYKQATGLFA